MELYISMNGKHRKIFTKGKKHMISQTEKDLIQLLKSFGLDKDTTVAAVTLAKTDENRERMIQMIIALYQETGEVTEQDIQKIGLMLTGSRKAGTQ